MREYKIMGIIFSNMHDSALGDLTQHRTMGSVPIGARYRLIDFTLSSMVNAGIRNVGVITKSNYHSLMDHLGSGKEWDLSRKIGGLVILPPFSRTGSSGIYRGSIEALHGIMGYLNASTARYVVLSDSDRIANIDLHPIMEGHFASGADLTAVYKKQSLPDNNQDVIAFSINIDGRITDVMLDPKKAGEYNMYINLMVIDRQLLIRLVADAYSHRKYSLAQDILQAKVQELNMRAHCFEGYCATITCMESYFAANMDLLSGEVRSQLFPPGNPIYTKVRDEVPAKYGLRAIVSNSLVADGCIIEGQVESSIIFRGVKIGRGAVVKNSVVMQGSVIGESSSLHYCIADKDVLVKDMRSLSGTPDFPIYLPKGKIV